MKLTQKAIRITLPLLTIISLNACTTTVRHIPNYDKYMSKNIGTLPASANVQTIDVAGNSQRMHEYESFVESELSKEINKALNEKGYNAKLISKRDLHNNKEFKTYDSVNYLTKLKMSELYTTWAQNTEFAYKLNESISVNQGWKSKFGTDLVVVSEYSEFAKTGGAKARDFMVDVLVGNGKSVTGEYISLSIAFVDTKSGAIIWTNLGKTIDIPFASAFSKSDEDHTRSIIKRLVQISLRPLPTKSDLLDDLN